MARAVGRAAHVRDMVLLSGDLGSGKSVFARALIRDWLQDGDADVPSPTFTLVQPYEAERGPIWHFDLYRLGDPDELWELGIEQAVSEALSVIEWPDRLGSWRKGDRLEIHLEMCEAQDADGNGETRRVSIEGFGSWSDRVAALESLVGS